MKSNLEQKIDKELADLGVRPHVYHIRAYGKGSQRKMLRVFNAVTIADIQRMPTSEIEDIVGEIREESIYGTIIQPATVMREELRKIECYGVAICDRRDNFSRKRGRIIAKGRLLKHLRIPELLDGTRW